MSEPARMTEEEIALVARVVETAGCALLNPEARRLLAELRRLRGVERAAAAFLAADEALDAVEREADRGLDLDPETSGALLGAAVGRARAGGRLRLLLAGAA